MFESFWTRELLGTDVYHIVLWFFTYSILGWMVESIYMSICNRKITNRGFIKGPICPIYGVGALTVYFVLKPFEGNYILLYIFGAVLATTIEYFTARIMTKAFGAVWWNYSNKPFNYKGILCLESTIAWGFYTVMLFAFLQKGVMWIVDHLTFENGRLIGTLLIIYYLISFAYRMLNAKGEAEGDTIGILQISEEN